MLGFFTILLGLSTAYILSNIYSLYSNYRIARASGVPVIVCPVYPDNIIWIIIKVPLRPILKRILPTFIFERINISIFGWEFLDKFDFHSRVGPTFCLATPGNVEFWIADPEVAQVVLAKRKEFVQPPVSKLVIGFLGPNILTVSSSQFCSHFLSLDWTPDFEGIYCLFAFSNKSLSVSADVPDRSPMETHGPAKDAW
jgi:hypothetical protein